MEMNQPEEALREFEISLRDSPNRFNGLYGAAGEAELSGDLKKAPDYYAKVVKLSRYMRSLGRDAKGSLFPVGLHRRAAYHWT